MEVILYLCLHKSTNDIIHIYCTSQGNLPTTQIHHVHCCFQSFCLQNCIITPNSESDPHSAMSPLTPPTYLQFGTRFLASIAGRQVFLQFLQFGFQRRTLRLCRTQGSCGFLQVRVQQAVLGFRLAKFHVHFLQLLGNIIGPLLCAKWSTVNQSLKSNTNHLHQEFSHG